MPMNADEGVGRFARHLFLSPLQHHPLDLNGLLRVRSQEGESFFFYSIVSNILKTVLEHLTGSREEIYHPIHISRTIVMGYCHGRQYCTKQPGNLRAPLSQVPLHKLAFVDNDVYSDDDDRVTEMITEMLTVITNRQHKRK
eukprot:m.29555 g.29555  ORF g.29555 m.29555 type:complete len:141 (+) comp6165_c0_seq1:1250-1672(+)